MSKRMYHPCHKLSVPSAKLFWCRHCMQMFEDAITRWKHSKQCRGNVGFKQKDQDGQVIQMYVKPDKVCYTTNLLPGQSITYKPQVKKTAADLKCVICHAKFSCLDDMREHVKYPCHKFGLASDSEDSDSERYTGDPTTLKIRRVESQDSELNTNTSTALAVLAEASKHVESLAHNRPYIDYTGSYARQGEANCSEQSIEVTPTFPQLQNFDELNSQVVPQQEVVITSSIPFIREDLEPVVIFIQAEDGQDIPETSLDTVTIQSCVKETVESLLLGQLLEIRINIKDKKVKHFVVGCNCTIHPVQDSIVQRNLCREKGTNTDSRAEPKPAAVSEDQQVVQARQDSDLVEILHGKAELPATENKHSGNQLIEVKRDSAPSAENIVIEEVYSSEETSKGQGEIRNQSNLEHSYQLTQGLQEKLQGTTQVTKAQETTFQKPQLPQLSTLPRILNASNHINKGSLGNLSSIVPVSLDRLRGVVTEQSTIAQKHTTPLVPEIGNQVIISEDLLGEVHVIEVTQTPAVTTEAVVTIDNTSDLLNNLVYPYTDNSSSKVAEVRSENTMASGEQLTEAEDWFGFAELSGESTKWKPPTCSSSTVAVQSQKVLEHDGINKQINVAKTDDTTNQNIIVVPIIANKQGKTKYKVLARQKVKDEEPKIEEKPKEETFSLSPSLQSMQYIGNNTWRGTYRRFHKSFVPSVSSVKYNPDSREVKITAELEAQQLVEKPSVKHAQVTNTKKKKRKKIMKKEVSDNHENESFHAEKRNGQNSDVHELNNIEMQGSETEERVRTECLNSQQECDYSMCNTTDEIVGQISDQDKEVNETKSDQNENKEGTETKSDQNENKKGSETKSDQNENKENTETNSEQNENKEWTETKSDQNENKENTETKSDQNENKEWTETKSDQIEKQGGSETKCDQNENTEGSETKSDQNEHQVDSETKSDQNEHQEDTKTKSNQNEKQEGTETTHEKCDSYVSLSKRIRVEGCVSPCRVNLKRDPSIDSLHSFTDKRSDNKTNNEKEIKELHNEKSVLSAPKEEQSSHTDEYGESESCVLLRRNSSDNNSMTIIPVKRHLSMDDPRGVSMVFNADNVQLRKSGRLKSAKCSSRYRGDYGIRAETYSKLVHTKSSEEETQNEKGIDLEGDLADENYKGCSVMNEYPNNRCITNKRRRSSAEDLSASSVHGKRSKECISYTEICEDDNSSVLNSKLETTVISADNTCVTSVDEPDKHTELKNVLNDQATCALRKEAGSDENMKCKSNQDDGHHKHCEHQILNCVEMDLEQFKVESGHESHESSDTLFQAIPAPAPMDCETEQEENVNVERVVCNCGNSAHGTNMKMCPNSAKQNCDKEGKVPCTSERRDICDKMSKTVPIHIEHNETTSNNAVDTVTDSQTLVQNVIASVIIPERFALKTVEKSDYVHSVGKSVNKKQNQATGKKYQQERAQKAKQSAINVSPDVSPTKDDPVKVLEDLRTKLFEKAGAVFQESDKPKQFESKLISSKRRQSVNEGAEIIEKEKQDCQTSTCSCRSGRATPKCSTPKHTEETGIEILEEVAQTLSIIQQAKRKTESLSEKVPKPKRQKFEKKKFMLRSMFKQTKDLSSESFESQPLPERFQCENNHHQPINSSVDKTQESRRNSNNELDSGSVVEATPIDTASSLQQIDNPTTNMECSETDTTELKKETCNNKKEPHTRLSKCRKAKSVKCQACNHTFKNKELLRKHYPCRIRQTRTWSQNILRPNRAYRRNDMKKDEKTKFRCHLPKSIKSDGKQRPKLLKPRKTKFRRVKGKRRRRLYILIQYLMGKRKIVQWPHLSVSYTDLSFKEQCMYKIGLSCSGNPSEGVENYSKDESAWFEVHRMRQKEIDLEPLELAPKDDETDEMLGEAKEKEITNNATDEIEPSFKESDTEEMLSETKEKEIVKAVKQTANEISPFMKTTTDFSKQMASSTTCEIRDTEQSVVSSDEMELNEISKSTDISVFEPKPCEEMQSNELTDNNEMGFNHKSFKECSNDDYVSNKSPAADKELETSVPDLDTISNVPDQNCNCDNDSNEIINSSDSSLFERSENSISEETYRLQATESQGTYKENPRVIQPLRNIYSQSLEQTITHIPCSDLCSTENLSENNAQENPTTEQPSITTSTPLLEQTLTDSQYSDLSSSFENVKGRTDQESSIVEKYLNKIRSPSKVPKVTITKCCDLFNEKDVNNIVCETIDAILDEVVKLTDTVEIKTNICTENDKIRLEPKELLPNSNLIGETIDEDTSEDDIQKQPGHYNLLDKADSELEKDFSEDHQSLIKAENCLSIEPCNPNLLDNLIITQQKMIEANTENMGKEELKSKKTSTSLFVQIAEETDIQKLQTRAFPCFECKENESTCLEVLSDLDGSDLESQSQEHDNKISIIEEMDGNEKLNREIEHCTGPSNKLPKFENCTTDIDQSDIDLKANVQSFSADDDEPEERIDIEDTFEHADVENIVDQIANNTLADQIANNTLACLESNELNEEKTNFYKDTEKQFGNSSDKETCNVSKHLSEGVKQINLPKNGYENPPAIRLDTSSPIRMEEPLLADKTHSDDVCSPCRKNDSFSDISNSSTVNEQHGTVAATTICYEQNGILISENLLTGDKNIVCQSQETHSTVSEDSENCSLCPDNVEVSDSSATSNVSHSVSVETEETVNSVETFHSNDQSESLLLSPRKSYEMYLETCDRDSGDKIHLDKHFVDGKQHLLEESKSASTITYKTNGIVICENLVTGEKTVVETEQNEKGNQEEDTRTESENESICSIDSRTQMSMNSNFVKREFENSKFYKNQLEIRCDTSQESSEMEATLCQSEHTAVSNEECEEQISSDKDAADTNRCGNIVEGSGESYQESTDSILEADTAEKNVSEEKCIELDIECNTVSHDMVECSGETYEVPTNTESIIAAAGLSAFEFKKKIEIKLGNEKSANDITAGNIDEDKKEALGAENIHVSDTSATKKNIQVLRENIEIYNVSMKKDDDVADSIDDAKKFNSIGIGDDCKQLENDPDVGEDTLSPSRVVAGNCEKELILQSTFTIQSHTPEICDKKIDKTQDLNYHTEIEVFRSPDLSMTENEDSSVHDISVYDVTTCDDHYAYQSEENRSSLTIELDTCKKGDLSNIEEIANDTEIPPVLIKVDEPCYLVGVYDDTIFSEDSQCSSGDPPTLVPEEETVYSDNLEEPHFKFESKKTTVKDHCLSKELEKKKHRAERHFLDVLGDVCPKDENVCSKINKEKVDELSGTKSAIEDYIGRHFSDVIDNSVHSNSKQKSHFSPVLQGYGNKEVTLAKIREMLETKNRTKKMFTKESLLKLRSDIAHLLTKIKTPVKKDPVWLKRDSLTAYHKRKPSSYHYKSNNNGSEKYNLNGEEAFDSDDKGHREYTDDESECSDLENSFLYNKESETKPQWQDQEDETVTKGGITDNILQMLTSFEDTGSVALNMSNLLDILAQNLGFSNKGQQISASIASAFDSDSDSDYSCSDEIGTNDINQENIKEPTTLEKMNEAFGDDEPPCLDDIPLPDDTSEQAQQDLPYKEESLSEGSHPIMCDKESQSVRLGKELNDLNEPLSTEEAGKHCNTGKNLSTVSQSEDITLNANTTELIESVETNETVLTEGFLMSNSKTRNEQQSDTSTGDGNKCTLQSSVVIRENDNASQMSFQNSVRSGDSRQIYNYAVERSDKLSKEKTGKGSSVSNLLKSITQLNTIETDDESDSGEVYDDVSVSQRMLELKALSGAVINSDIESDISDSEIFDPNDQSVALNCSLGETEKTSDLIAKETMLVIGEHYDTCDESRLDLKHDVTPVSTSNYECKESSCENIQQEKLIEDAESNTYDVESMISTKFDNFIETNAYLSSVDVSGRSEEAFSSAVEKCSTLASPVQKTVSVDNEIRQSIANENVFAKVRLQPSQADESFPSDADMQPSSADGTVPADAETQPILEDETDPSEAEIVVQLRMTDKTFPIETKIQPCLTEETVVADHEAQQSLLHETFPTEAEIHLSTVDETVAKDIGLKPCQVYVTDLSEAKTDKCCTKETNPAEAEMSPVLENGTYFAKAVITLSQTYEECQIPPSPANEKNCTEVEVDSNLVDNTESTKIEMSITTDETSDFITENPSTPTKREYVSEFDSSKWTCFSLTSTNYDDGYVTTTDNANTEGSECTAITININNEQVSNEEQSEFSYEMDTGYLSQNKTNDSMPLNMQESALEIRETTVTTIDTENVDYDLTVDDCESKTESETEGIAKSGVVHNLAVTEVIKSSEEVSSENIIGTSETEDIKITIDEKKTEVVMMLSESDAAVEDIDDVSDSINISHSDDENDNSPENEEVQLTKTNSNSNCSNVSSIEYAKADELCDGNVASHVISPIQFDTADDLKQSNPDRESIVLKGTEVISETLCGSETEESELLQTVVERNFDGNTIKTIFSPTEKKEVEDIKSLKNNESSNSRGANEINDQFCEKDKERDEKVLYCESEISTDNSRIVSTPGNFEHDRSESGQLIEVEIETTLEIDQTKHYTTDVDMEDNATEIDDGDGIIEPEAGVFYQEEVIIGQETKTENQKSMPHFDIKQIDSDLNLSENKINIVDDKQTNFDRSIIDEDTNSTVEYEESDENIKTFFNEEFSADQPNNNTSTDSNFHSVKCEANVEYTEKENVPISCYSDEAQHDFGEFSEGFFETIAEKVKRKQRERLQTQARIIPQQLSRIHHVPAVKKISIFRSSMLDQRIRQNSLSSLNIKCLPRKKRKRCKSLPKEIKLATLVSYGSFGIKPCSVRLTKLKPSTIQKYIHSNLSILHEKSSEERNMDRPPIKLRIKLSDIIMPCSPYSPFQDAYSSTDEHTLEEIEASQVYSNNNQIEPVKAAEDPLMEAEAAYRSKSVDNVSQRLKPLKIKLSDLKMSKSKSCDFKKETLPVAKDVDSVKPNQNSAIAKQICKIDLQLSESDSDSDSDKDAEMQAMDKVKDTVQSVRQQSTSAFSWTKITFQGEKKDPVEADTQKERSSLFSSDSLQRELAILSKENQITSCGNSSDEEGFEDVGLQIPDINMEDSVSADKEINPQFLRQNNSDADSHTTLTGDVNGQVEMDTSVMGPETDCQEVSTDPVCEMHETISSGESGIQEIKFENEIDKATTRLEREIFRDQTVVSTDNGPEVFSCVVERADDFETCEAVQTLETFELSEVIDTENMVIVDYKDMQETDKIPSHIQTDKCIDKYELFNRKETKASKEQFVVSDHVRSNNDNSVREEVIPNKYLYGISEESQSSTELIEEQVLEELTIEGESVTITSNEVDILPIAQISVNSGFSQLSDSNTEPGHQSTNQYRRDDEVTSSLDHPLDMSVEKTVNGVFSMEDVYRVDSHHLISQAAESVENNVEMDYDSDVGLMMNNLL